ncbi:H/ACA ribonucleoprotein complex non-core subunit NAF1 isoform X2 [Drosophila sulfurigaster albostrigata]|uniref:H/ACA ribonucleoprotein complex non-core subunit NAF1 isoform X2 n=1 Tax=Drosophila sulfurigaster albostrigata TaxID=89887 RepID=UPI002D21B273|nr:H/ACA ribonucleoprotein complex non-core subunit NAF1 isoform X2 [Drosophila sulfurigaster albostrigata]
MEVVQPEAVTGENVATTVAETQATSEENAATISLPAIEAAVNTTTQAAETLSNEQPTENPIVETVTSAASAEPQISSDSQKLTEVSAITEAAVVMDTTDELKINSTAENTLISVADTMTGEAEADSAKVATADLQKTSEAKESAPAGASEPMSIDAGAATKSLSITTSISEEQAANAIVTTAIEAQEIIVADGEEDIQQIAMDCETIPTSAAAPTTTGLGLLATYSSDVDSDVDAAAAADVENSDKDDDVVEVPVSNATSSSNNATHRRQVVTVVSSDSDSSDSDSDSEGEYLTELRKKIDRRINTEDCDEEDDELDDETRPGRRRQPPKVRGEMLLDELPPIDQLEITVPEDECIELGKVQSIVDQLVIVSVLPNSMLFDLDTVLFLEKGRKVLGQVFDVLGQVADPLYCVRFNSNAQIKERGINVGDVVYCAPQTEHTQFVILSKVMQIRGSDASWENDVEPPPRFLDYSDDEAEREARAELRKKRQRERTNSTDSVDTVATEASSVASTAPSTSASRQRGRRAQRESRQPSYQNGNQQQQQQQQQPMSRSQSRDSDNYNYHPSYNPGSWHSNYYHNFHPPAANFNMMPGAFPMPQHGYGYGMPPPPPPHPYAMPPPMTMPMMGMPPPQHMYPPPPPHPAYGAPPPHNPGS